jgi:hypothetical protein
MGWLSKLPVSIYVRATPDVQEHFVSERRKIDSVRELKAFVKRWIAVWDVDDPKDVTTPSCVTPMVFKHFKRLQHHNAKFNPDDANQQMAVRLILPKRMLEAGLIAHKFMAPFNVALIQKYGDDEDKRRAF